MVLDLNQNHIYGLVFKPCSPLVAKVKRLALIMGFLIPKNQSFFIKERFLVDNILVNKEVVEFSEAFKGRLWNF
jgi:hypothetical protein